MNILTLCLDGVVLAAAAYPSGFSYSLASVWRGAGREASTSFLTILALPYLAVIPAVWLVAPALLAIHASNWRMLPVAVLIAPLGLLLEYGVHGLAQQRLTGVFPRKIRLQGFWSGRLSKVDHGLLVVVAVGEEFFFRQLWLGVLLLIAAPVPVALIVSSVAYGLNHFYAGGMTAFSKALCGLLYGGLYLLGGHSIWLPIVAHVLQNLMLFQLSRERHV